MMQGDREYETAHMHEKFIVESSAKSVILAYRIF